MRTILLSLMAAAMLQAGSYEYAYSPLDASVASEKSVLEGRSFERIVRFEAIGAVDAANELRHAADRRDCRSCCA